MKKEQVRQKYLECIEPQIKTAEEYCEHQYFQKLYAVCMSCFGYELFFPICSGFGSKGIFFDSFCRLFGDMLYNIEDDGALSFVSVVIKGNCPYTKKLNEHREVFIMRGEADELDPMKILELATFHGIELFKGYTIKSWKACNFRWQDIDHLYSLLADWNKIKKVASSRCDKEDAFKYLQLRNEMKEKFEKYISLRQSLEKND